MAAHRRYNIFNKLRPGQIVHVEWNDSSMVGAWRSGDEFIHTPTGCESVSFVVAITTDTLVLASTKGALENETLYGCSLVIPRTAVRRIKILAGG